MSDFLITPPYDVLLRGTPDVPVGLYHLQIASAEQLTRLHYSMGSLTAVKHKLKVLTGHGYTQVDSIPVRQLRSPYFYTLGPRAMEYLSLAGFDVNESWRGVKEVGKGSIFIEHTLEINDVLISAALLHKVSGFRLDHFTHERVLKRTPYKAGNITVIPDAYLDFRHGDQRLPVLLEHDRGTEEQQRFRQKIRGYTALIRSEAYKQLFGTKGITVAFTTFYGEHRLEQMRRWARSELEGQPSGVTLAFYFASLERPPTPIQTWMLPVWYSVTDSEPQALIAA